MAVDAFGPSPVEVGDRFECADARCAQATVEAAALTLGFFDAKEFLEPWFACDVFAAREQSKQSEGGAGVRAARDESG